MSIHFSESSMSTLSDLRERYQKNSYKNHTASSLLECFRKTPSKSIERFFIYEEILKRKLPDDVIAKASGRNFGIKLKDSEFVLFSFNEGGFLNGGFAKSSHVLVYLFFCFGFSSWFTMLLDLDSQYHIFTNRHLAWTLRAITFSWFFLLFTNSITSQKVILTNHRLVIRRTFFRIIHLKPRWLPLNNSLYINNIHNVLSLYFSQNYTSLKKFVGIPGLEKLLDKTQLWMSLIKITKKASERFFFVLTVQKAIFLFEALSLIIQKHGGSSYNIPIILRSKEVSFNYRFSHCETSDLANLLKQFSKRDLPDFSSKPYFGLPNLARLTLYITGNRYKTSIQNLPPFLTKNLMPQEFPLAILPICNNSFLIGFINFMKKFKNFAMITTQGIIVFNQKNKTITQKIFWSDQWINVKWFDEKVIFTSLNQEIFSTAQELVDFPFYDVLDIAQGKNKKKKISRNWHATHKQLKQ